MKSILLTWLQVMGLIAMLAFLVTCSNPRAFALDDYDTVMTLLVGLLLYCVGSYFHLLENDSKALRRANLVGILTSLVGIGFAKYFMTKLGS